MRSNVYGVRNIPTKGGIRQSVRFFSEVARVTGFELNR
jgi:hypothetical protein